MKTILLSLYLFLIALIGYLAAPLKVDRPQVEQHTAKWPVQFEPLPLEFEPASEEGGAICEESSQEEEPRLAYVPNELLIKIGTRAELARLLLLAIDHGGELVDAVPDLRTIRLRFADRDLTIEFRERLGDGYEAEHNQLVKAPDYPEYESRQDQNQTPTGFDGQALDWLGIATDHAHWGAGVLIAVLDTGVYPHAVFEGMNVFQLDLLCHEDAAVTEYDSHGMAVASIAAQVAPASDLLSIRVLNAEGLGDSDTVAQGIVAAVEHGASVINLSIGSYGDGRILSEAVSYTVGQGVAVVAASGNDGTNAPSYPAAYEGVIGVSAVDADGQIAGFSNYGESVDLAAPGVDIHAAWEETSAVAMSGTSAAAPFVTGAIAALLSTGKASTSAEAVSQLQFNATDLGDAGIDADFGHGALQLSGLF